MTIPKDTKVIEKALTKAILKRFKNTSLHPSDRMRLALDKDMSLRRFDSNGFMHVESSPLTRVQVAPYYGYEIPNAEELGLVLNKIYHGYRPAEELGKPETILSIQGIPIQFDHHVESPDDPKNSTRVGFTGEKASFDDPFLVDSLHIVDRRAQNAIEDGSMRELSLCYEYEPDFTAGETPEGEPYDFIMRNIKANHVALVNKGRAGPNVLVKDSSLEEKPKMDENGTLPEGAVASNQIIGTLVNQAVPAIAEAIAGLQGQAIGEGSIPSTTPIDPVGVTGEDDAPDNTGDPSQGTNPMMSNTNENAQAGGDDGSAVASPTEPTTASTQNTHSVPEPDTSGEKDKNQDDDPDAVQALQASTYAQAEPASQKAFLDGYALAKAQALALAQGATDQAEPNGGTEPVGQDAEPDTATTEDADTEPDKASDDDTTEGAEGAQDCGPAKDCNTKASDSAPKSIDLNKLALDTAKEVEKRLEAKYKALEEVKPVLGQVKARAYDSAGDIYKEACCKIGLRNVPKGMERTAYLSYISGARAGNQLHTAKVKAETVKAQDSTIFDPNSDPELQRLFRNIRK